MKRTYVIDAIFDGMNSSMSTMSTFVSEWNIYYEVKQFKEKMKIISYVLLSLVIGTTYCIVIYSILK